MVIGSADSATATASLNPYGRQLITLVNSDDLEPGFCLEAERNRLDDDSKVFGRRLTDPNLSFNEIQDTIEEVRAIRMRIHKIDLLLHIFREKRSDSKGNDV